MKSLHEVNPRLMEAVKTGYSVIMESYNIQPKDMKYWLQLLVKNGMELDDAKNELAIYVDHLKQADRGGFLVYRVVIADSESDIDTVNIGEHFTYLPPTDLINYAEGEGTRYVIECLTVPNSVDYKESLENFTQLPDENEINFKIPPKIHGIYKYDEMNLMEGSNSLTESASEKWSVPHIDGKSPIKTNIPPEERELNNLPKYSTGKAKVNFRDWLGFKDQSGSVAKGTNGKWYGWSHRAVYGFGIGDKVKKGDCAYIDHVYTIKTDDQARETAEAFADSVS